VRDSNFPHYIPNQSPRLKIHFSFDIFLSDFEDETELCAMLKKLTHSFSLHLQRPVSLISVVSQAMSVERPIQTGTIEHQLAQWRSMPYVFLLKDP